MNSTATTGVNPNQIMQVGMGFWASKTLLTAVNMSLFTGLAGKELSAQSIKSNLGLHQRGLYDFLDTLVALGFLNRTGIKENAMYANTDETNLFLDKNKPTYIGGILEMANNRLYPFWGDLEDCLKTGSPQNEAKTGEASMFDAVYADEDRLKEFVHAMAGVQMGNFMAFAQQFDFSNYTTICDIGGAGGHLCAQVALNNPHMTCTSFDLPAVTPVAQGIINAMNLADKVHPISGDFFTDDFPAADVITMGNILHDWGKEDKQILIKKAYNALPIGGALIVIENIIDDNREQNAFGLMMSLNMNIETLEGYDFSLQDFKELTADITFSNIRLMPLTGPTSAIIAIK
ncbi:MAG: hypothetical protein KC469_03305 [Flavobacteriaceae bacterium]|nr:hypothetical protein [Flavobacteriaceae bacterium]